MTWFISLILAGAVWTSGNNINTYQYQNTAINDLNTKQNAVALDETERFEQTYPFNSNGKIEVSNINGSIKIEAWDRSEIKLVATKIANTKERLADVDVKIDATQDSFKVKTDYQNWKNRNWSREDKLSVEFELTVPRTAILDDIESVNGSVEVSNMTNQTGISVVNGSIKATNLRGTTKLDTVNGTVYADFDNLSDDSTISLGTVNGTVKLAIPSSSNATVKANTLNGSISNEFGLPIKKGEWVGRDLYGKIGNGNVKIKLNSVNGSLSINNKDGGKTNPVINLLPQKTSDDFDDSFDVTVNVDTAKINADIDKAMKESQKAIAETRKETAKIKEKIKINAEKLEALSEMDIDVDVDLEDLADDLKAAKENFAIAKDAMYLTRRSPFVEEKTGSFEVEGSPNVIIKANKSDVFVRGWDKQEVKYVISRLTRRNVEENNLKTNIRGDKSKVEIKITDDEMQNGLNKNEQVRVEVFVPKKSNLKISTNGQIRLEDVSGELELNGGDGTINVRDANGKLKVESADALVRIIGFDGELETMSGDGDVYLEGNFKKINAESGDGKIYLTLANGANATMMTNGIVDLENISLKTVANEQDSEFKYLTIGKGDAKYNFNFAEGKLIVRSKDSISEN